MFTVQSLDSGRWSSESVGIFSEFADIEDAIDCANGHLAEYGGECRIVDERGNVIV